MDKIIRKFFDEIDFSLSSTCGTEKCDCVTCLKENYFESTEIDYNCENKQKLYVVRYLPVHIKEIQSGLNLIPKRKTLELLNKKVLNVMCLGGGPGTDNAAFNKWLVNKRLFNKHSVQKVNLTRVDRCTAWSRISPHIIAHSFPDDIVAKYIKNNHDITKPGLNTSKNNDLVIISYLLSEIPDNRIPILADNIKNNISDHAVIIINDRNQHEVNRKVSALYEKLGCDYDYDTSQSDCGFSFDDDIVKIAKPKFNTNSIRHIGEI